MTLAESLPKLTELFWLSVDKSAGPDGCWLWLGRTDNDGYGKLSRHGASERTHRIAFVIANGPLSPGQIVRHTCDNPTCCNPAHLTSGTHKDNAADRDQRGRNGKAKLTPDLVCLIRTMDRRGVSRKEIAAELGAPITTIYNVADYRTWKWVSLKA